MLRGRNSIAVGCVHDDDSALGRRFDIDIIDPDTGPADNPQFRRGIHQIGRYRRRTAYNHTIGVCDPNRNLFGRKLCLFHNLKPGIPKGRKLVLVYIVSDEYFIFLHY